ncbi:MAG: hypothetical protein JW800_02585 [Candidatus Omnitrophica bacterium]|nr:hypothetical protein [Candidatus Omnitrophota bacterium]
MSITKAQFEDRLKRAYDAEAMKCDILESLCEAGNLNEAFDEEVRAEVLTILTAIREDTEHHKDILSSMIKEVEEGSDIG